MITETIGTTIRRTYDSLSDFADYAENFSSEVTTGRESPHWAYGEPGHFGNDDAFRLARDGWQSKQDEAINIAEEAIREIETEMDIDRWEPVWDVTGGAVDIGQYLAGEPECMMEYPVTPIPSTGRVVTICTSVAASGSIDPEELISRGTMIAGLAMMLERMGYNTEIWADLSVEGFRTGHKLEERILVKSARDMIDPSRILYAIANPSMLRIIGFAAMHGLPYEWQRSLSVGMGYGMPASPVHDLPDGTIYMDKLLSYVSYDAKAELVGYLRKLGIIE